MQSSRLLSLEATRKPPHVLRGFFGPGGVRLGATGAPNAGTETGGPATRPRPAAPNRAEPSGPMGDARASHCRHLDLTRAGNAAAYLDRIDSEKSISRMNAAAVYAESNRYGSAVAAGSHGDHAPASIGLGRNCGRS